MLCVTTDSIDGKVVLSYCGIVASEVIFGTNFLKEFVASISDFAGGRTTTYEKVFEGARAAALEQLVKKASALQANAVLTVRFSYQVLGPANGMMMVAATGTAVQVAKTDVEKAKDEAQAAEDVSIYFLEIAGSEKGPFSLAMLRELLSNGRIASNAMIRAEGREGERALSDLLK